MQESTKAEVRACFSSLVLRYIEISFTVKDVHGGKQHRGNVHGTG